MRFFASALRAWRRMWGWACEVAGILGCFALIAVFLPLVPVFRLFEDIQTECDDE